MVLKIDDCSTIADIQEKFNECFPGLKIEFYRERHHWKEPSLENEMIDPSKTIGEVRKKHDPGIFEIKSWYQTGRVEQDFQKLFGLNVQIFRKEGGVWKQTASSDKFTLRQQQEIIGVQHKS